MISMDNKDFKRFFGAILNLESVEECERFFEDLCTIKELNDFVQRLQVVEMLSQNKSYQEISATTGASSATISRVNRCFMYGAGGYKEALEKLNKGNK